MTDKLNLRHEPHDEIRTLRRRIAELERELASQEILIENLQRTQFAVDHAREAIFLVKGDASLAYVNNAACLSLEYTREELLKMTVFDFDPALPKDQWESLWNKGRGMETYSFETQHRAKSGRIFPVEIVSNPVTHNGKEYRCSYVRDITERKSAEEKLLDSQNKLNEAMEIANLCTWEFDVASNQFIFNDDFYKLFHTSVERESGYFMSSEHYAQRFLHPDDMTVVGAEIEKALQTEDPDYCSKLDHRIICVDGVTRHITVRIRIKKDAQGRTVKIFGVNQDISDRKRSEETLQENERLFRIAFDNAPTGMSIIGPDGFTYLAVNPLLCEMFGYDKEEFLNNTIHLVTHPDDEERSNEWIRKKCNDEPCEPDIEKRFVHKDGHIVWGRVRAQWIRNEDGSRRMAIAHIQDITERRQAADERLKLEKQLSQAQKMEAIGTLAGGVAHDFNNILTIILGYVSMLLNDIPDNHPYSKKLKNIEIQALSAAELSKQLLGFARGGKYEVMPTDLNDLVRLTAEMFGRTRKEISITCSLQPDLCAVEVDRVQIERVLMNLFVNAWQAMPEGGSITLLTDNVVLDIQYCRPHAIQPGAYAKIAISDSGMGMDEATQKRIFEPFFTTKEKGIGTGLGLASAYGIIKNHQGVINVYSEPGHGSTFTIYLPASQKGIDRTKPISKGLTVGVGTILLVDDQDMVSEVGAEMLEILGYDVLIAGNGQEAIRIYAEKRSSILLVILDMIMPGMSGSETFDALKQINPDIRVLLSSGYSMNGQASSIIARGCAGFIQKPFNLQELSNKIQHALTV